MSIDRLLGGTTNRPLLKFYCSFIQAICVLGTLKQLVSREHSLLILDFTSRPSWATDSEVYCQCNDLVSELKLLENVTGAIRCAWVAARPWS